MGVDDMTTETIALLTILRDETQSRDVLKRCNAEIARLAQPVTPRAVLNAWQTINWSRHEWDHAVDSRGRVVGINGNGEAVYIK